MEEYLPLKSFLLFLLIDQAKMSIKPNGKAISMTMSTIDKTEEAMLDPELNDIVYKLMHEAVNKGKNVRTRVLTKNFWQLKRDTNVNLQHFDLIYFPV